MEQENEYDMDEVGLSEEEILSGFAPLDVQHKIDTILDTGIRQDAQVDNTITIDTEEKIKQMLNF